MANNLVRRVRFMMLGTLIFSFVLAFLIYQAIFPLMHGVNFFLLLFPSVIVVMIPMFRANPTYPEKEKMSIEFRSSYQPGMRRKSYFIL